MKLNRLTERIWICPFEEERDRLNLGYIRGDRWSLAVDAGHSADHIRGFYHALEDSGLPLPELTVMTHWHWDHTFAMHAAHGLCLANALTNRHLIDFRESLDKEGSGFFFSIHGSIRKEYKDGTPVVVTPADMVFSGEMLLDAGSCPVRVFQAEAPHTDDSTLIEVPGEKTLFLGDSDGGEFPEGTADPGKARTLAETIKTVGPEICIPGHWTPLAPDEVIREMMIGE